jgi:hypothetical protein
VVVQSPDASRADPSFLLFNVPSMGCPHTRLSLVALEIACRRPVSPCGERCRVLVPRVRRRRAHVEQIAEMCQQILWEPEPAGAAVGQVFELSGPLACAVDRAGGRLSMEQICTVTDACCSATTGLSWQYEVESQGEPWCPYFRSAASQLQHPASHRTALSSSSLHAEADKCPGSSGGRQVAELPADPPQVSLLHNRKVGSPDRLSSHSVPWS